MEGTSSSVLSTKLKVPVASMLPRRLRSASVISPDADAEGDTGRFME
jgi:hypothetical protein